MRELYGGPSNLCQDFKCAFISLNRVVTGINTQVNIKAYIHL